LDFTARRAFMDRSSVKRDSSRFLYPSLILAALFLSYWVPSLLSRKHYKYTIAEGLTPRAMKDIDMSVKLLRITPGSKAERVSLGELAAKNPNGLIVNFWATWCAPCLEEIPALESLHRQLAQGKDLNLPTLITVSVDEKQKDVSSLYKTLAFQPTFEVLHDPDGTFAESLGTTRFPETYWLKPNGEVKFKWLGPQFWLSEGILRRLASG
jgi:thiol-disulfide isomerase/thioredoxin